MKKVIKPLISKKTREEVPLNKQAQGFLNACQTSSNVQLNQQLEDPLNLHNQRILNASHSSSDLRQGFEDGQDVQSRSDGTFEGSSNLIGFQTIGLNGEGSLFDLLQGRHSFQRDPIPRYQGSGNTVVLNTNTNTHIRSKNNNIIRDDRGNISNNKSGLDSITGIGLGGLDTRDAMGGIKLVCDTPCCTDNIDSIQTCLQCGVSYCESCLDKHQDQNGVCAKGSRK